MLQNLTHTKKHHPGAYGQICVSNHEPHFLDVDPLYQQALHWHKDQPLCDPET